MAFGGGKGTGHQLILLCLKKCPQLILLHDFSFGKLAAGNNNAYTELELARDLGRIFALFYNIAREDCPMCSWGVICDLVSILG